MESSSLPGPSSIESKDLVADDPYVKWEGRYEYKEAENKLPAMVYLYHTATGFTITFTGTSLSAEFYHSAGNIYYDVAIDDETLPNPALRRFALPNDEDLTTVTWSGLSYGEHTIKCLKMDEAYDGLTALVSFSTDGYIHKRDVEEDNENFKFMFVCASGGSGFGSLGFSEGSSKVSRTKANSSSLHSFNYLTARRYGADVQYVATSGWGVAYPRSIYKILDYTGNTPENSVAAAKTTAIWDHTKWNPDVIIFNIGGNDTGAAGYDVDVYKETVVLMVNKLHADHPKAKMIWVHTSSKAGAAAVTAMTDAGIMAEDYMKVSIIPKVGQGTRGINTYGASNHNSILSHLDGEEEIVKTLSEWRYKPFVDDINYEDFDSYLQKA